ncbi:SDR family oxidoreductase [Candidatus Poriferisocius sp.]|uniref:SDR family oxidoreductase n=1 Tax=Candidatus Poriferisocius sp. TaxID=3101276 RepID=UPI003B01C37A
MSDFVNDLFGLKGRTAVVTGGSSGIGKFIAEGFVRAGARVYIVARSGDALEEISNDLSEVGTCIPIVADLSTMAGVRDLADQVVDADPDVHILVNNAGVTFGAPLEDFPEEELDRAWNLNVKAVFHLTRFLLPALRAAASDERPSSVINVSSVNGSVVPEIPGHKGIGPVRESWGYGASKAGVNMLTRHLGAALAVDNVTVNAIAPGPFESRMTAPYFDNPEMRSSTEAMVPIGRIGTPIDVQGASIFLASRAGAYLTGAIIPVDGGWSTHG